MTQQKKLETFIRWQNIKERNIMVRIINWDDFQDDELDGAEYEWRHALERKKNKKKRQFDDGSRTQRQKGGKSTRQQRGRVREIHDEDF